MTKSTYNHHPETQTERDARMAKLAATFARIDAENPGLMEFLKSATWSEFAIEIYFNIKDYGYVTEKQLAAANSMMEKCNARQAAQQSNVTAFDAENPGLIDFLKSASTWSTFAESLYKTVQRTGNLSEKQLAAAKSMKSKCEPQPLKKIEPAENQFYQNNTDLTELLLMVAKIGMSYASSAHSLYNQIMSKGSLTERQLGLAEKIRSEYQGAYDRSKNQAQAA